MPRLSTTLVMRLLNSGGYFFMLIRQYGLVKARDAINRRLYKGLISTNSGLVKAYLGEI